MFLLVNVTLNLKHALAHGTVRYLTINYLITIMHFLDIDIILSSLLIFGSFLERSLVSLISIYFTDYFFQVITYIKTYRIWEIIIIQRSKCVWYFVVLFNIDRCHHKHERRLKLYKYKMWTIAVYRNCNF